jgi:uncharacterized protein YoxC
MAIDLAELVTEVKKLSAGKGATRTLMHKLNKNFDQVVKEVEELKEVVEEVAKNGAKAKDINRAICPT